MTRPVAPAPVPPPGVKKRQVLTSLLPILIIFALTSTFFMFKWKRDYVRVARDRKGAELALSHLERTRELLDRVRKFISLPSPDDFRLEDIAGLSEEALKGATTALGLFPGSEEAMRLHGQALELMYNFEEARASYKDCETRHHETPARYLLGLLNTRVLQRARLVGMKTSLVNEERLSLDASEPLRRYMAPVAGFQVKIDQKLLATAQTCVVLADRNFKDAVSSADIAETGDPTEWLPPYLRGIAQLELKNPAEALKSLETAARLAPAIADIHAWTAAALQALKRRVEAINALSTALTISEHFLEAWYLRGTLLFEEGRFNEARTDFENCLKLRPSLPEVRLKLGIASFEQWRRSGQTESKDLETAVEALTQYLGAHPQDAPALTLRARARMGLKDWDKAEADLSEIIKAAPPALEALTLRAAAHEARGRWDAAIRDYESILAKAPDPAAASLARRGRARARASGGRVDEALADLEAMLTTDPNDLSLHLDKASLLGKAGRPDEGLAAADKVLEISRGHPRARALRARLLLDKGDAPAAIQEATQAWIADPQLAEALVVRGHAYVKQDLKGKAAEDWKRALEIRPDLRGELEALIRSLARDP